MTRQHRRTLGVSDTATSAEIKDAYRRLAKKYHPDTNQGDQDAARKFREITDAYTALKSQSVETQEGQHGGGHGFEEGGHWNIDTDIFEEIFESVVKNRSRRSRSSDFDPGFGDAFTAGYEYRGNGKVSKGKDIEVSVSVDLKDAYTGVSQVIEALEDSRLRIKLPAGVSDGAVLRIKGKGHKGTNGGTDGDILVTVRHRPHGRFSLRGEDLVVRMNIPFTTALLGGELEFVHLDGKKHLIDVPAFPGGETTLVAKGKGWPGRNSPSYGNLVLELRSVLPRKLTERQKRILREFHETQPAY